MVINGFDINSKLTLNLAKQFKAAGMDFVGRYVGRDKMSTSIDLDAAETNNIMAANLMLLVVQHCPIPPWVPTKDLGVQWGKNAVLFAQQAGYQQGKILYLDLEGIKAGTPIQVIKDYCNYWYDNVYKAYTPGQYDGYDIFLSPDDLYGLKVANYWRAFGTIPDVSTRGYSMLQQKQQTLFGLQFDPDVLSYDNLGGFPPLMMPPKFIVNTAVLTNTVTATYDIYSDGSFVKRP